MSLSYQNMVLSAKDVAYLTTKRECLGKLVLSVKGTVTAFSDVTRAGRNEIILVQVDKCIFLVIKDFHPEWHSVLEVGDVFVFHNLRLTTLEKGISKACSVLLVLETSSLTCLKDENAVTPVSLQDWLKMNRICDSLLKPKTLYEAISEEIQELVNYEGTVTSTDTASIGMFVLDGKLRFVTTSSSVDNIKKHCRVSVYNAHIIKDGGQAYLMCCMRSCIHIHESVSSAGDSAVATSADGMQAHVSAAVEGPVNNKLRTFIHKLIKKYGLNLKEILALQQLYSILSRLGRSKSCQENMLSYFAKSDICANLTKSCLQATDLFIFHEQFCPFNQSKSQESRIPQIMDLHTLKKEVTNIKSTLDSSGVLAQPGITCQSSPHHLKVCFSSGKILTGCIMTSSEGTLFWDGTSELRVIILSDSDAGHTCRHRDVNKEDPSRCCKDTTDHSQPHLCCQCCFGHCQPAKQLTCPVLDPWLVGATICVTKFHVVLEGAFNARTGGAGKADKQNLDDVCMYMAFSLLDCIVLDAVENMSPVMVDPERVSASPLPPTDLSSHERLPGKHKHQQESACYVYVCEKQPLTYAGSQFKNEKSYQFQLLGSKFTGFNTENTLRCCETPCVRRRRTSSFIMEPEVLPEKQENSLQDSLQQRPESICASFLNSTAKWYSCFTSGHLYRLVTSSNSSDSDPFKCKLLKVLPQKVAKRYNVRMNIEIPEDVFVERLPLTLSDPGWGLHDVETLHPIGHIMSASFSETVVSFQGVIVGRDFCQASFNSSMTTRGKMCSSMTNTKLGVQDIPPHTADNICGRAITVYLDAPRTVYTLGLVPGAVVKFYRVERKISKAGNVYCRFIAVSVAEVVQFRDLNSSTSYTRSQTQDINIASLPRELLFNIRQRSTKDWQTENQVFSISCHIDKIFSLHIKTVCSSCKSMFSKMGCQSRVCGSAAWPVAVARAVLLVGDGTCPATVKIWDSHLICRLLTLTSNQWEDLITEVTGHGEVILEYSSPPTSNITMFLQELISSPLVLRPCTMAVRKYKGKVSSDLDNIRLEDFQENEVKVGKHVLSTLSLPRMQLDCLAISEIG